MSTGHGAKPNSMGVVILHHYDVMETSDYVDCCRSLPGSRMELQAPKVATTVPLPDEEQPGI